MFPREKPLADSNVRGLTGFDIVLFGHWGTPDGVDPAVVREEHAADAQAELYELAAQFSRAGAPTDVQLHFGPTGEEVDDLQTRIAEETDADAVIVPGRITMWTNVLVPLRGDRNVDRIVEFLDAFEPASIFALELFHATDDASEVDAARAMLDDVKQRLLDLGFTESDLEVTVDVSADPDEAIVEQARGHNVVVIGETEERPGPDQFLGPTYEHLTAQTDVPVIVVRQGR